eukprot:gb/GECG01010042.1/.p1 GENE.gb/GECG01010042.1/~~gb/GECG01010042.1/.p1  ORF type:complete len:175 (+),score=45.07 gb/GECG01010042.1/:1-525(+)
MVPPKEDVDVDEEEEEGDHCFIAKKSMEEEEPEDEGTGQLEHVQLEHVVVAEEEMIAIEKKGKTFAPHLEGEEAAGEEGVTLVQMKKERNTPTLLQEVAVVITTPKALLAEAGAEDEDGEEEQSMMMPIHPFVEEEGGVDEGMERRIEDEVEANPAVPEDKEATTMNNLSIHSH